MPASSAEGSFLRYRESGDAGAFAEFYDLTVEAVLETALRLARGPVEAEDLVQATYLAALEGARSWDARRPVAPWLCGICANQARKVARRFARAAAARGGGREVLRDPSAEAERHELEQHLAATIDLVPAVYRPVLVLSLAHGLTPTEIGRALDRPPVTVRSQLYRGLELLRATLPKGLALGALAWLPTRGLAAVKTALVAEAVRLPVAAAAFSSLTGALLVKKTLAAVAVSAVLITAWLVWPAQEAHATPPEPRATAAGAAASAGVAASVPTAAGRERVATSRPERAAPTRIVVVYAQDGTPAAGLRGRVVERARPNAALHAREITTDAQGAFVLEGLEPGMLTLELARCEVGFAYEAGARGERVVRIPAGMRVTVLVTDERGVPIPNAEVWCSRTRNSWSGAVAGVTGPEGTLELRDLAPSRHLGARAPGYQPASTALLEGHAGERFTQKIVLRAGGTVLRGIVRGPSGAPCPGALVQLTTSISFQRDERGGFLPPPAPVLLRTDASGCFEAAGLWVSATTASARAVGTGTATQTVILREGMQNHVELRLPRACALRGSVRRDDGMPVAGATVQATSGNGEYFALGEVQADAQGRFLIEDLTPGETVVTAHADGRTTERLEIAAGGTGEIELVIARPRGAERVAGTVVDEDGKPWAGCLVTVEADGRNGWDDDCRTERDGTFRFERCAAETVVIGVYGRVDEPVFPILKRRGVARGTSDLRIVVPRAQAPEAAATVQVVDETGAPLPRAELELRPLAAKRPVKALAAASGVAWLGSLPPGACVVRVRGTGRGALLLGRRELANGTTLDLGTVRLVPGVTLRARVRAADGGETGLAWANVVDGEGERVLSEHADAAGEIVLGPLGPGRYVARVGSAQLAETRVLLDLTIAQDLTPTWTLARGTPCSFEVRGLTLGAEFVVSVHDGSGAALTEFKNTCIVPEPVHTRSVLAPGDYEASVEEEATGRRMRKRFTVGATAPRVVLQLE